MAFITGFRLSAFGDRLNTPRSLHDHSEPALAEVAGGFEPPPGF
jgi:hypothetical protein